MKNNDFWELATNLSFENEADVEIKFVLPFLQELGYRVDVHIASKVSVKFIEGKRGRPHEADFVVYSSSEHNRNTSLITIEVKAPYIALENGFSQAESYSNWLRTPIFILTNGNKTEVWQLKKTHENILLLSFSIEDIGDHRSDLASILSENAVRELLDELEIKNISVPSVNISKYIDFMRETINGSDVDLSFVDMSDKVSLIDIPGIGNSKESNLFSIVEDPPIDHSCVVLNRYEKGAFFYSQSSSLRELFCGNLVFDSIELYDKGDPVLPLFLDFYDVFAQGVGLLEHIQSQLKYYINEVTDEVSLIRVLKEFRTILVCNSFSSIPKSNARNKIEFEFRQLFKHVPFFSLYMGDRYRIDLDIPCLPSLELVRDDSIFPDESLTESLSGQCSFSEELESYDFENCIAIFQNIEMSDKMCAWTPVQRPYVHKKPSQNYDITFPIGSHQLKFANDMNEYDEKIRVIDPIIDITLRNNYESPVLITKIGCLCVDSWSTVKGVPKASKVICQDLYELYIPDFINGMCHAIVLEDYIDLPQGEVYRYKLRLLDFQKVVPGNESIIRLYCEVDDCKVYSDKLYLGFY